MQKTANELISDAYLMAGLRSTTDTVGAEDAAYGLTRLNGMLDQWSIDGLFVKQIDWYVENIAAGESFTIGPGQTVDTGTLYAPPMLEDGIFIRYNDVDFPIRLIDLQTYSQIPYKSEASQVPQYLFYDVGNTTATAYVYPAMIQTTEWHIPIVAPLGSFAAVTTSVDLPQGYSDAISMSLAELLCIGVRPPEPSLMKAAARARSKIKEANTPPPGILQNPVGYRNYCDWRML